MSGLQLEQQKKQRQIEQMAREDQQVLRHFQQTPGPFQTDKKKSLARQYRDYALYQCLDHPEQAVYGPRQEAAGYIQFLNNRIRSARQGQSHTLGDTPLQTHQCLLHLAASRLLEKELKGDVLIRLMDSLTAGSTWAAGEQADPNTAYHQTLRAEGQAMLKEIYFRQLEAMDQKYGEKLCAMSPAAYLQALPQIEADFACLEDMRLYFQSVSPLTQEEAPMGRKLQFYTQVWANLQERYQLLSTYDEQVVTEKGTLSKAYDDAYRRDMKALQTQARKEKLLLPRKNRPPLDRTLPSDQVRSQALDALTRLELAEQEEQQRDELISQQFEELTEQQAKQQAFLSAMAVLRQDNPSPDALKIAQNTIARFPKGYTEEMANQKITELAEPINQLSQQRGKGEEAPIESPETLLERCAATTRSIQELARQMETISDADLPAAYVNMMQTYNLIDKRYGIIRFHPIYNEAVGARKAAKEAGNDGALAPQQRAILDAVEQLTQTEASLRDFKPILQARMSALARSGVAHRQDGREREDLYLNHKAIRTAYEAGPGEPMSLQQALNGPLPTIRSFHLDDNTTVDYTALRRHLDRMKTVADFRAAQPDYYRLGLSEAQYRTAQQMCDMLPHCQRLLELTLRYYFVIDREGRTSEAIRRDFDQTLDQLQEVIRQWSGSRQNIQADLARDLSSLHDRSRQAAQALSAHASLQGDKNLKEDLETMNHLQTGVFLSTADPQTALTDFARIRLIQRWLSEEVKEPVTQEVQEAAAHLLMQFGHQYQQAVVPLIQKGCRDCDLLDSRTELEACAAMGNFWQNVLVSPKGKQLRELWSRDEHYQPQALQLNQLHTQIRAAASLAGCATGLALQRAQANGVTECTFQYNGTAIHIVDGATMRDMITALRQENRGEVNRLRTEGMEQLHREETETIEMKKRVRMGVGRELEASRRKHKMVDVVSFVQWGGNRIGSFLQLLNWTLREKRTMNHGAVRYEESCRSQDTLLQLVPEMAQGHLPQQWQRGSQNITPPVALDALYHDENKANLLQALTQRRETFTQQDPLELEGMELNRALEALERWCKVSGIVNTDVTEMEMAFLDVFLKSAAAYLQANESSQSPLLREKCDALQAYVDQVKDQLRGTMADTMSREELDQIAQNTTAYVEDTTYTANLEQSNLKDIPLFLHTPSINDVRQSSIGDCWLVSAISSVVKTSPDFIRSMFHDLGDGNVLVRLYAAVDAQGKTVDSRHRLFQPGVRMIPCWFKLRKQYETGWGSACDCTWVQLLEKAYALGGFNTRNEVEVRDGRLYNVSDELTMGDIRAGVAHLTGQVPQFPHEDPAWKEKAPHTDVLSALTAGIPLHLASGIQNQIRMHFEAGNATDLFMVLNVVMNELRSPIIEDAFGDRVKAGETIPPEEQTNYLNGILNRLYENLELIKNGETPEGFDACVADRIARRERGAGTTDANQRKYCARYFSYQNNGTYSPGTVRFFFACQQAIEQGGAISISIPHCVNIIDTCEKNGRLFVLMRDPFNIYNTEYTRGENGAVQAASEGLAEVFTKRQENRHLVGATQAEILQGGFRGTSWIELNEIARILVTAWEVTPQLLHQDNRQQ